MKIRIIFIRCVTNIYLNAIYYIHKICIPLINVELYIKLINNQIYNVLSTYYIHKLITLICNGKHGTNNNI